MKIKKIVLIALSIVVFSLQSFATTYNVYHGDSIQDVIDIASNGDIIHVYSYYNGYEGFDFDGKSLEIYSQGSPMTIINGDLSSPSLGIVIDMTYIDNPGVAPPKLHGFKIIGSSSAVGVKLTNFDGLTPAKIYDNVIDGLGTAIYVGDNQKRIEITTNELLNNDIAYYSKETSGNVGWSDWFNYNVVYDNDTGLYLGYRSDTGVLGCLFYDNGVSIDLTDDTGQYYQNLGIYECTVTNTDTNNNDTGFFISEYGTLSVISSIIYGNDTQIDNDNGTVTVTYSDIEDGYTGTGNIDDDPDFCMETNYEFNLLEGSPCIDSGDPNEIDPDGTRLDMGCYPTLIDIKYCEGNHWNWVSFPRLEREGNDPVIAYQLLEDMIPFPEAMTLMYGPDVVLTYVGGLWSDPSYTIRSDNGYKLDPQEDGSYILPEPGSRLPDDHTKTVYPNQRNWVGYWLPMTQSYQFALGDQLDHVTLICAEDWFVYKINGQWYGMSTATSEPGTFKYGKGYAIVVDEQFELHWISFGISEPYEKEETEFFTYEDKPNYEMIEIEYIENGENILEVGIYQGDVCVGASKVEGYPVHLMAYTDAINRSGNLSFELVSGGRNIRKIDIVWKYNFETEQYESTTLHPFESQFSLIKLGKDGDNSPQEPLHINLSNYPNPFNPTTTISFELNTENTENIEIAIYNLKGQKVKQLVSGIRQLPEGKHSVIWDGRDENNNPVSSGIYLYRLETADKVISKKMILMK